MCPWPFALYSVFRVFRGVYSAACIPRLSEPRLSEPWLSAALVVAATIRERVIGRDPTSGRRADPAWSRG